MGKKDVAFLKLTLMDAGIVFYHPSDERAYFEWLARIPCVDRFGGEGQNGLFVHLKRKPRKDDLRELIAIGQRYGANMKQLARFETTANRKWFRNPRGYWYEAVFGVQQEAKGETPHARNLHPRGSAP